MAKKKKTPSLPNPIGRPSEYKPEYCDLIKTYLKDGKSLVSFASLLDVHTDTIQEWAKVHPAFSVAKKIALMHSQHWWEEQGREGLFDQTFKTEEGVRTVKLNAATWIYNMKCRFRKNWHDSVEQKVEIKHEGAEEVKELVQWLKATREIE